MFTERTQKILEAAVQGFIDAVAGSSRLSLIVNVKRSSGNGWAKTSWTVAVGTCPTAGGLLVTMICEI